MTSDDPRRNAPACPHPPCPALAGDANCYTATGFPRGMHAARRQLIAGGTPTAEKPEGSLAGRRPSDKQNDILGQAITDDGRYELSGYRFHGDAQRRAAMLAMADPARSWFTRIGETDHGTVYEITETGRAAWHRYQDWMNGGR